MSLEDVLQKIEPDPEGEQKRQLCLARVREISSRSIKPADTELLQLISDLFQDVHAETPFTSNDCKDYDHLIESLSFTTKDLSQVDAGELKTAWSRFLSVGRVEFGWPLNVGVAGWYSEHGKVSHALAVYEHLYALIRQGELHEECGEEFEGWLIDLLSLRVERGLHQRARHLCEVIEDFYNDGYMSLEVYFESLSFRTELVHAAIKTQIAAEKQATQVRLEHEGIPLLDFGLLTRSLIVEAELWSSDHWNQIYPGGAPLYWTLAIESEFHDKVFVRNRERLQKLLEKGLPRGQKVCGLKQIERVIEEARQISG